MTATECNIMPIAKSYSRVSQPPFLLRISRCAILSGCLEKSLSRCFPPDLEAPAHARGFLFPLRVLPKREYFLAEFRILLACVAGRRLVCTENSDSDVVVMQSAEESM